jgi:hypothetical protein
MGGSMAPPTAAPPAELLGRLPNIHHSAQSLVYKFSVPGEYMSIQLRSAAFGLALLMSAGSTLPAFAQDSGPVSVKVNMARILRISAPANTVIIGNPTVADVTIQDPQTLVLTGKSYGRTNMIVLDSRGSAIADTMIEVVQAQADIYGCIAHDAELFARLPADGHDGRRPELFGQYARLVQGRRRAIAAIAPPPITLP